MNKKSKGRGITAGELMSQLEKDPSFIQARQKRERKLAVLRDEFQRICAPVMKELAEKGFKEGSLDDLRRSGIKYKEAIPILLKWLSTIDHLGVKEAIVRAISVPWAKPVASNKLIPEFFSVQDEGLKWAIGNALEVLADDAIAESLMEIAKDRTHGKARQMIVLGLGKIKDPRVVPLLHDLLRDEDVFGHAIMALGRLKSRESEPLIEKFLQHKKAWIRKEARSALAKIQKEKG